MGSAERTGTRPDTVLIVDDHRAFAEAMAMALSAQPDLRCLELASSATVALERISEEQPDVILLDIGLPDADGIVLLQRIRRLAPDARVLLITGGATPDVIVRAAEAGADALLHKEYALSTVIEAVRSPDDFTAADPHTLRLFRSQTHAVPTPRSALDRADLTGRELEVLKLLADGIPVKQIARQLDISVNTCRGYVRGVLEKLTAHSQLEAVVKAIRLGLLPELRR